MKYSIEIEVEDDLWFSMPELSKRMSFLQATNQAGAVTGRVTLESILGAPHGYYRNNLDELWQVDSHGAKPVGDSYYPDFKYVSESGPYTYLGYDMPEEAENA